MINLDKHEWEQGAGEDDEGHAVNECRRCDTDYCEVCDTDPLPLCDKRLAEIYLLAHSLKRSVNMIFSLIAGLDAYAIEDKKT